MQAVVDTFYVDPVDAIDILFGCIIGTTNVRHPGTVDQDVDPRDGGKHPVNFLLR